jgi:DNA-binding transcriptional LysR family regulator
VDKLTQIEAFVTAVDAGSLARAALVAEVTPVMIGRRIDALEKRLGVRLLHRSTRPHALTQHGSV